MAKALDLHLHEKDFYVWKQEQVKLFKKKAIDKLDLRNLIDEIESIGNQNTES